MLEYGSAPIRRTMNSAFFLTQGPGGFPTKYSMDELDRFFLWRPMKILKRIKEITSVAERIGSAETARKQLEIISEFGPAYVKLGQVIALNAQAADFKGKGDVADPSAGEEGEEEIDPSMIDSEENSMGDFFDEEKLDEVLESLHDNMPAFDSKQAVKIVEEEMGAPICELFEDAEESFRGPVAAASLAQVYRAKFRQSTPEGGTVLRDVAVKVKRPDIEEKSMLDVWLIKRCSKFFFSDFMRNTFRKGFEAKKKDREENEALQREMGVSGGDVDAGVPDEESLEERKNETIDGFLNFQSYLLSDEGKPVWQQMKRWVGSAIEVVGNGLFSEFNFTAEGVNQREMQRYVKENPSLNELMTIPEVFWIREREQEGEREFFGLGAKKEKDIRGKDRVVVSEWIEGERCTGFNKTSEQGRQKLGDAYRRIYAAYLAGVLDVGFMHGDPHPGNFLLMEDGRVGIVDFGIVVKVSERVRKGFRIWFEGDQRKEEEILAILPEEWARKVSTFFAKQKQGLKNNIETSSQISGSSLAASRLARTLNSDGEDDRILKEFIEDVVLEQKLPEGPLGKDPLGYFGPLIEKVGGMFGGQMSSWIPTLIRVLIVISSLEERTKSDIASRGELTYKRAMVKKCLTETVRGDTNLQSLLSRGGGLSDDGRHALDLLSAYFEHEFYVKEAAEAIDDAGGPVDIWKERAARMSLYAQEACEDEKLREDLCVRALALRQMEIEDCEKLLKLREKQKRTGVEKALEIKFEEMGNDHLKTEEQKKMKEAEGKEGL